MTIKEILVLHHSHVDIGYTHPQRVVWDLHRRYLDEVIDLCEQTAGCPGGSRMKWTCEVTNVALHWLNSATPAQIERMRRLVSNGQVSFGPMWAHWTALHPEDLLIESLQPMKRLRELLGADFKLAMQTDVNGVPWPVSDMLLDAGIDQLMMSINIHMGGYPLSRPTIFRWQTPSGREIRVFSGEHYNAFTREAGLKAANVSIARMAQGLEAYFQRLERKGWKHDFAILTATHPIMDDNGPPNPELPDIIRRWNESGREPFIRMVSLNELHAKLEALDADSLPLHSGDWTDFWTNGVAASALDVAMSRNAHGALWSARALSTQLPQRQRRPELIQDAIRLLHLANEHTWNTFASTAALGVAGSGKFEPVPEAEQRHYKSDQCAGAFSLARMLRRDALDFLAGNPAQSRTQDGLLLFNPSEITRTVCLRVPNELIAGSYHMVGGTKHRFDVIEDLLAGTNATAWIGPVDIPPLTLKKLTIADIPRANFTHGLRKAPGIVESRFWRLTYNAETGVIKSLLHLESGRECFDKTQAWDLFGPVHETVSAQSQKSRELRDPRYDLFHVSEADFDEVVHSDMDGWATDWKATHSRPSAADRIETSIDGEAIHLHRWLTLPGVKGEMKQTISLLAHEPRVRFTAYFNKSDEMNPESLYFTFPFKMDDAQVHFDTAGTPLAYNKEQLPGACRDWFTAGSFVAVEGTAAQSGGCITLACPDAPLFHIGGFHYGRHKRDVADLDQAFVIAWPTNNFWDTNFRASQPGYVRFRYELTWTPEYQPAAAVKFATAMARPVTFHPIAVLGTDTGVQTLLDGLDEALTVNTLKPDQEHSVILGLRNHSSSPVSFSPRFPGRDVSSINQLDTLERDLSNLPIAEPISLQPRRTTLLRVEFKPTAQLLPL